jgi:hypothetical protein
MPPVPPPPAEPAVVTAYAEALEELLVRLIRFGHLDRDSARVFVMQAARREESRSEGIVPLLHALHARLGSVPT